VASVLALHHKDVEISADIFINIHLEYSLGKPKVIMVKQTTSVIENNGSTYLLIPPALRDHLNLKVGKDTVVIEDKEKGKGKYAAFWSVDANGKKE
jgi:hypothetical protein